MTVLPYLKAVYGALCAGAFALQTAAADNVITTQEWIYVAVATITAGGIVWGVPNLPKPVPPVQQQPDGTRVG